MAPSLDAGSQPASSDPDSTILGAAPLAITQLSTLSASDADRESDVSVRKRKRVRTGCFTCRDRHLKCDAAQGQCQNCLKSGRRCRRGVRLNFFDTQVSEPPTYIKPPVGNEVVFRDDSRLIASEYVGGEEMYPSPEEVEDIARQHSTTMVSSGSDLLLPLNRLYNLDDPVALSLMQVFVSEIGPWLDIVDEMKHFTRILPFYAVEDPLLRAAFTACVACYTLRDQPDGSDERLQPYITAAEILYNSLKDPQRDTAFCAAAAVIVHVMDFLTLGPIETLTHLRGTNHPSYLVRDCQWTTLTSGLSGACTSLSILLELLDCINPVRMISWDPDTWGIDMNFTVQQPSITGNEELWTRRMIYICAKSSDLRLVEMKIDGASTPTDEAQRAQQWHVYSEWCDRWYAAIPRSMLPLGHVQPWQRNPQSVFPQVWLLGKSAVIAHMLYQITRIMLLETDPLRHERQSVQQEQEQHAYFVCGIMSNEKNSGIPVFAVQLFCMAAGYLKDQKAREEALAMLYQLRLSTGINTAFMRHHLQETWAGHSPVDENLRDFMDTTLPLDFHASDYPHSSINDALSHSLAEPGSYLHYHLTHDGP
ncbi:hypothetical protein BDV18DRAFT_65675 [Aspergillus unguis]